MSPEKSSGQRSRFIARSVRASSSRRTNIASVAFFLREIPFRHQVPLPVDYKGLKLDCAYRLDMLVASSVVVEVKAVTAIEPVHEAQVLTYMRMGGWDVGLLINFNVAVLRDGIYRKVF